MASDIENAIKQTADKIAKYVEDAATLTVETKFVPISASGGPANFDQAVPAARTIIKIDGDSEAVVPMQQTDAGLVVDNALFDLHERNVNAAIVYRTKLLTSFLDALKEFRK